VFEELTDPDYVDYEAKDQSIRGPAEVERTTGLEPATLSLAR
jgi:hypothetical protein